MALHLGKYLMEPDRTRRLLMMAEDARAELCKAAKTVEHCRMMLKYNRYVGVSPLDVPGQEGRANRRAAGLLKDYYFAVNALQKGGTTISLPITGPACLRPSLRERFPVAGCAR